MEKKVRDYLNEREKWEKYRKQLFLSKDDFWLKHEMGQIEIKIDLIYKSFSKKSHEELKNYLIKGR